MKWPSNFTYAELIASSKAQQLGIDNTPPPEVVQRLFFTAQMLQRIRDGINKPIVVPSGYRCKALNRAVGGVPDSDHITGDSADIVSPEFGSPYQLAAWIHERIDTLGVGQLILEGLKGKRWVHVSTKRPRNPVNRVITITDAGTRPGIHQV